MLRLQASARHILPAAATSLLLLLLSARWLLRRGSASRRRNLPPGPRGLPLVGSAPWLLFYRRHEYFSSLAANYGDICTVALGPVNVIVLNSLAAVKEAFSKNEDIAGRGLRAFTKFLTDGKGIATNEGQLHKDQRRYCLRVLRDFGFGRINFEGNIHDEVQHFMQEIDRNLGAELDVSDLCARAITNVISSIVIGTRMPYGSEQMQQMVQSLHELNQAPGAVLLLNFTTVLDPLASWFGMRRLQLARGGIRQLLQPIVQQHRAQLQHNQGTDFLFTYLIEQERRRRERESDADDWDDRQLEEVLIDLMVAGSDTTRSTLVWMLNCLAGWPLVQEAVRQELLAALGDSDAAAASVSDLPRLPHLDAVIQEVFRLSALVPTSVPHCCTKDTTLLGYHLPKGTFVFANTFHLSRDRSVFKNAHTFDPFSHFLLRDDANGEVRVVNKEKILPFSYGRRSCIGESLSRMELLQFTSSLLRRYRISLPAKDGGGIQQPDCEGSGGLFNICRVNAFVFERL